MDKRQMYLHKLMNEVRKEKEALSREMRLRDQLQMEVDQIRLNSLSEKRKEEQAAAQVEKMKICVDTLEKEISDMKKTIEEEKIQSLKIQKELLTLTREFQREVLEFERTYNPESGERIFSIPEELQGIFSDIIGDKSTIEKKLDDILSDIGVTGISISPEELERDAIATSRSILQLRKEIRALNEKLRDRFDYRDGGFFL